MPKFDKPDSPNIIWGVNALEGDLTRPSDSKIQTGWIQEKPPYEFENYSMNKLYQGFAYYNQLGFPEWDSVTEYQAGKSYVQGSNDRVYRCIQTHTNRNPATAGNETFWEVFEGNRQASTSQRGVLETSTISETSTGSSDTVAVTPISLLQGMVGAGNISDNGHVKIPVNISGVRVEALVQWGRGVISSGTSSVSTNFDINFPNKCFQVVVTDIASSTSENIHGLGVDDISTTSFITRNKSIGTAGLGTAFTYIAIGW